MVGPSLYVRNGYAPLLLQANSLEERRPYYFQPLPYPIHLAIKLQHASFSIKDSVHFKAHPQLEIFDGLPRKLWNEAFSIFYHSRDGNLRVIGMRGTLESSSMELVVMVLFKNGQPRCHMFDRGNYPELAAKLLNHTWSEDNERWVLESPELSKLDICTRISQGGRFIIVGASISQGVVDSISSKRIWIVSFEVSKVSELPRRGESEGFSDVNGLAMVGTNGIS